MAGDIRVLRRRRGQQRRGAVARGVHPTIADSSLATFRDRLRCVAGDEAGPSLGRTTDRHRRRDADTPEWLWRILPVPCRQTSRRCRHTHSREPACRECQMPRALSPLRRADCGHSRCGDRRANGNDGPAAIAAETISARTDTDRKHVDTDAFVTLAFMKRTRCRQQVEGVRFGASHSLQRVPRIRGRDRWRVRRCDRRKSSTRPPRRCGSGSRNPERSGGQDKGVSYACCIHWKIIRERWVTRGAP
jgi:hypothetical protein